VRLIYRVNKREILFCLHMVSALGEIKFSVDDTVGPRWELNLEKQSSLSVVRDPQVISTGDRQ